MSLHGSARHLELAGNFGVVTALQKQFNDLLFAGAQPNGLRRHHCPLGLVCQRAKTSILLGCFHIA
jgi:hypothetical protein